MNPVPSTSQLKEETKENEQPVANQKVIDNKPNIVIEVKDNIVKKTDDDVLIEVKDNIVKKTDDYVLIEVKDNIVKKTDDDVLAEAKYNIVKKTDGNKKVIKKTDNGKKNSISTKPARIPKKEMPRQPQQGPATGGATPLEGLSTGADTGEQEGNTNQIREQSMGMCTIQMIRLADDRLSPRPNKVEQWWWVTPETESKVKDLMEGEDIIHQRCTDCGFKGTKKCVKIHCMQHYCKYMCQCLLFKTSRDVIYDHQVSKGRTEEHGGADRRIYCVDRASYPALCLAMAREDPLPFGETRPNRRG